MTYTSMMVNVELGRSNKGLLTTATGLANRFNAHLIGIGVCKPMQFAYGDGYISGDLIRQDQDEITEEIHEAETEFHAVVKESMAESLQIFEWRSAITLTQLSDYVAQQARCADLIITCAKSGSIFDDARVMNIGDLVMQTGRPVLIIPPDMASLDLNCVVIGWNDSRESRRAIIDALPLLRQATKVVVVEISKDDNLSDAHAHLDDVVAWLHRHDIKAESLASFSVNDDTNQLLAIIQDYRANMIVVGAFGHSRFREWVFGGVTHDLLLRADCCTFVSH
ncbi:nucleotide-binding universal stress UspA family protein [Undibacterium sp. GrIS 1.2]|uniref:universal stress protein n=1 Tax=Undibacterium sp. GrIS 1.2 TaxID=3143933 RepID=UPI003391BE69